MPRVQMTPMVRFALYFLRIYLLLLLFLILFKFVRGCGAPPVPPTTRPIPTQPASFPT